MKRRIFSLLILLAPFLVSAQTETTNAIVKKLDVMTLYFYKNTLKMFNQTDNKDFDLMVKNIEKMRFVMLDKNKNAFTKVDYKKLLKDYKNESYEEALTTRMDGRNFDVYLKDKKGSSLGTIILVNDSSSLYILDMIGTIDLTKATSLFSTIGQSSEIASKIKNFLDKSKKEDDDDVHHDRN